MDLVDIPQGVDDPPQFLLWSLNDVAPILVLFLIGFMLSMTLLFTAAGFASARYLRRLSERSPDLVYLHVMYWYGIGMHKGYSFGNGFSREFYAA